ncbi:MAG TPA: alpha/beta hydrolase-fold protein [Steroidobacteraceae bacterium]|jgi:pimeloyl-ACP methyl ester carboxylesterase
MRVQRISIAAGGTPGTDIVLLPPARQSLEDFERAGFGTAVQRRQLSVDLYLVDPGLTHVADRSWLEALQREVIAPLRAKASPLWLGGISLGAFMALTFAAQHPALLDGLCLLAPYAGSRIVAAEVARSPGLAQWQPDQPVSAADDDRRVWAYLRDLRPPPPQLFLGLSRSDRFADTQRLLARALPAASHCEIDGSHDWPAWQQLWNRFLDRLAGGEYAAQRVST